MIVRLFATLALALIAALVVKSLPALRGYLKMREDASRSTAAPPGSVTSRRGPVPFVPERSRVTIDATSSLHPIHSTSDGVEGYLDLDVSPGVR